jgi:hypothetical protein
MTKIPNNKYLSRLPHDERKIFKQIRDKLSHHKAVIAKADKGNTIIILSETDYRNKTEDFY